MSYVVWDLETTIKSIFKRKASPWHPENFIVASGYRAKGADPVMLYTRTAGGLPSDWFTRMLGSTRILVGFNIAFDLLWALQEKHNLDAWMEWVSNGGQVWDCQLAEYLLDGMVPESHMLSLNEVAVRYGGTTKVDEVKLLWEQGVNTCDINRDLLEEYLIGSVMPDGKRLGYGDIGNTELAYLGQVRKAKGRGMVKIMQANMGCLLGVIEMMRNGLYVNKAEGLRQAEEMAARLKELTDGLQQYLPENLPFEFKWTNRYHLSPLIFGGEVKYKKRTITVDENNQPVYPQKKETHAVLLDGSTVALDDPEWLSKTDDGTACVRYKGGKNAGEIKTKQVTVPDIAAGPKSAIREFVFPFPGFTKPDKKWASSTEGLYSVAADVIEELGSRDIPFLKQLAAVAKLDKDLSTYYITYDADGVPDKGMLTLVGDDGILHGNINMTRTVTSRLSSSDPNLQNIPRGDTSAIKSVFESRWGKNGRIGSSDFKSLEVYVQAWVTLDTQLISDLRAGLDMHCARLATAEGVDYATALLRAKGDSKAGIPAIPEWDVKRTHIKTFSFQRAYGAGAQAIADYLGVSVELVEQWIEADVKRYPGIEAFYIKLGASVERSRVPTSRWVPHPEVPGLNVQLGSGSWRSPSGLVYRWTEYPAPKWKLRSGVQSTFMPTELRNYPIQGEGCTVMKVAIWLMVREFYRKRNWEGLGLLINTVHDASYTDYHLSVEVEVLATQHACMEAASELMEYQFGWEIPVAVPADTETGPNMKDASGENVPSAVYDLAAHIRKGLRKRYMNDYQAVFLTAA